MTDRRDDKPEDGHRHDHDGHDHEGRDHDGHGHEHGHDCGHDHSHDHDHEHEHKGPVKPRGMLVRAFAAAHKFGKSPRGMLATTALLATTVLATPVMGTAVGAGLMMLGGLYLLTTASDVMLDHAEGLAAKLKMAPLILGVALGALHSVPELLVAMQSVFSGAESIAMGNLIGANIAHVFLILGAAAAIGGGISSHKGLGWKYNMFAMAGATLGFGALLAANAFTPLVGIGMVGAAAAYLAGNVFVAKKDSKTLGIDPAKLIHNHDHGDEDEDGHHGHDHQHDHDHEHDHAHHHKPVPAWQGALWTTAGLGSLIYASHLAVEGASQFALGAGISQAVVGTLAVAIGTSLPELTTSVKAARRGNTGLAVGNVLGCNIFNILFVGGALALANSPVPEAFSPASPLGLFNLVSLGASAALMTGTLAATRGRITRKQGLTALGLYGAWCAANIGLGGGAALHSHDVTLPDHAPQQSIITETKTQQTIPTRWTYPQP